MNKTHQMLLLTMMLSVLLFIHPITSYTPSEDELVFDQQVMSDKPFQNSNLTVGIFVKNFFNYTITNITISLNLTDPGPLLFTSCDFGELSSTNVTLNTTIQSSSENGFTPSEITYGYMSSKFLKINITEIGNNTKFIFFYNITSEEAVVASIPMAIMTYYDNWGDLQELSSELVISVDFQSTEEEKDPDLPDWKSGKKISSTWGLVVFALAPVLFALLVSFVLYIKRR